MQIYVYFMHVWRLYVVLKRAALQRLWLFHACYVTLKAIQQLMA